MNSIIISIALIAGIISIIMFLLNINLNIEQGTSHFRQGFVENRLFGVYTSPNTGALFGIISIIAGCINSVIKTGRIFSWKRIYIVNAIVQIMFYTLSLSNGGFITIYSGDFNFYGNYYFTLI